VAYNRKRTRKKTYTRRKPVRRAGTARRRTAPRRAQSQTVRIVVEREKPAELPTPASILGLDKPRRNRF